MSIRLPKVDDFETLVRLINDRLESLDTAMSRAVKVVAGEADFGNAKLKNVGQAAAASDAVNLSAVDEIRATVASLSRRISGMGGGGGLPEVIEPLGEDLVDVTVTKANPPARTWLANGDLQLQAFRSANSGYAPGYVGSSAALSIGQFAGVRIFWETGGDPLRPLLLGEPPYTANYRLLPPDNLGEVDVVIPRGKIAVGTNYLILFSYGETRKLPWKPASMANQFTYWEIVITEADLDDNPGGGTAPGDVSNVQTAIIDEGIRYRVKGTWDPPSPIADTAGYEREVFFYADPAAVPGTHYYSTYAGSIDGALVRETLIPAVGEDGAPRDTKVRYCRLAVAPFNSQLTRGNWVLSSNVATISPLAVSGQSASVAATIGDGPDSRSYMINMTLTPPDPLASVVRWEPWAFFFDASTGGSATHSVQLTTYLEISDLTEPFGQFPRGVDSEPWMEPRVKLIYADGSKSDWIIGTRQQVAKQIAPPVTLTNITTKIDGIDKATGLPLYGFLKGAGLSGSKDALHTIQCQSKIWTDTGLTIVDEDWKDIGDLDPKLNDTWPTTSTQPTDLWPLHGYTIYTKVRIRATNSDGVFGPWIESAVMTFAASAGFDLSKTDLTSRLAFIENLLTRTIQLDGEMLILDSGGNQNIRLNSSGILLGTSARYLNLHSGGIDIVEGTSRLDMSASAIQMKISGTTYVDVTTAYTVVSNVFQVKSGGTAYMTVDSSKCQLQVEFEPWGTLDFTNAGSVSMGSKASDWRTALNVSQKVSVTGATVTLAKITPGGTDGSITYDNEGRVTGSVAPT